MDDLNQLIHQIHNLDPVAREQLFSQLKGKERSLEEEETRRHEEALAEIRAALESPLTLSF